ncbi:uncharacterized protein [Mobula birostris]|uniref:uncharacterized protein n=1 Tax=Mobula birostris TaxID=1983395 RepID=UPI003B28C33A
MTLKAISNTRWECHVESVKVLRYQLPDVGNALLSLIEHATQKGDSETTSAARGLEQEIMSWKLLLTVSIWYNVLHEMNRVSKLPQSPKVGIDVLQHEVEYVPKFLKEYRENGLSSTQTDAKDVAEEIGMPMVFPTARIRKPKRQFQYESQSADPSLTVAPEERYKREVFLPLVDSAITGISERFKLMESFYSLFGFIYGREEMKKAT